MNDQNPFTHPHEKDAARDAIQATDGMPTETDARHSIGPAPSQAEPPVVRKEGSLTLGGTAAEAEKMLSGGEELRDHDFPIPAEAAKQATPAVIRPMGEAEPETVRSGGAPGSKTGDRQRNVQVPTVMDQRASEPNPLPDK